MARTTLDVEGMSCGGCEDNVVDSVGDLEGVDDVDADHEAGTVTVDHDGVDENAISTAVADAGYEVVGA